MKELKYNTGWIYRRSSKNAKHKNKPDYVGTVNVEGKIFHIFGCVKNGRHGKWQSLSVVPIKQSRNQGSKLNLNVESAESMCFSAKIENQSNHE